MFSEGNERLRELGSEIAVCTARTPAPACYGAGPRSASHAPAPSLRGGKLPFLPLLASSPMREDGRMDEVSSQPKPPADATSLDRRNPVTDEAAALHFLSEVARRARLSTSSVGELAPAIVQSAGALPLGCACFAPLKHPRRDEGSGDRAGPRHFRRWGGFPPHP
jgi:hypothetical protein